MRRYLVFLFIVVAAPLGAQPSSSFDGTVIDSATGVPVRRAVIWLNSSVQSRGDSVGRFAFDRTVPGTYRVSVHCFGVSPLLSEETLWEGAIEITTAQHVRREFVVDARRCDQRPVVSVHGEFRGFYESGFEHNRFVPCPGIAASVPPSLSAVADSNTWVWTQFGERSGVREWPETEVVRGVRRWYVHWRGTIKGPDHYGHMSAAEYQANIEKVISLRRPTSADCGV